MRVAHGCMPDGAVGERAGVSYRGHMKLHRLSRGLRWTALAIVTVGFTVWIAAGARVGWTQTSIVTQQTDAITGIDYPVREAAFRPGIEVPLLATLTAATLAGISWAANRRELRHS